MKCTLLIDCDSFYASCEKVFRPDLKNKPVVVLSNNDGFIIAKSSEAKKLGFDMLEPYFKVEAKLKKHKVAVFSANFALYGDLSARVMQTLELFSDHIEVYSIDEAFVEVDDVDPEGLARKIRQTVWKWVGIPVSIGVAQTKTLAKIATKFAKKNPDTEGVYSLLDKDVDLILEKIDVGDIWGVGHQYGEFLRNNGVMTAKDLKYSPEKWVKNRMTVMGLRCVKELNGIPCFSLEEVPEPQKAIVRSRSFGRLVESLYDLQEATSAYSARACEKLRQQHSLCSCVGVFIHTNPHKNEPQYSNSAFVRLPLPTANTPEVIQIARFLTKKVYKPGFRYLKAGVMLAELVSEANAPENLFVTPYQRSRERDLMTTIDKINTFMGPGTIKFGSTGLSEKPWKMRQSSRSPRYTSKWEELPKVKA
jgi:DNA polymerase V